MPPARSRDTLHPEVIAHGSEAQVDPPTFRPRRSPHSPRFQPARLRATRGPIPQPPAEHRPPSARAGLPLRVHIITVRWGSTPSTVRLCAANSNGGPGYYVPIDYFHGFGIANLQQDPVRGFEYNFDCPAAFTDNQQPDQSYPARWKTTDQSLEILTQPVASDHLAICELHVTMKPQPFDLTQRPMLSSASLGMNAFWLRPRHRLHRRRPRYPVRLHIITSLRRDYQNGTQGYGIANLEGPQPRGVDYTFDSNAACSPTPCPANP